MKLFPNFTSIPFDYLLISWVTNYVNYLGFLTFLSWIVSIENSCTLSNLLEFKFGLSSEFFDEIPVRILLDLLFRVFRFSGHAQAIARKMFSLKGRKKEYMLHATPDITGNQVKSYNDRVEER